MSIIRYVRSNEINILYMSKSILKFCNLLQAAHRSFSFQDGIPHAIKIILVTFLFSDTVNINIFTLLHHRQHDKIELVSATVPLFEWNGNLNFPKRLGKCLGKVYESSIQINVSPLPRPLFSQKAILLPKYSVHSSKQKAILFLKSGKIEFKCSNDLIMYIAHVFKSTRYFHLSIFICSKLISQLFRMLNAKPHIKMFANHC